MNARMNRLLVSGLLVLVLGSGVAIGIALERVWLTKGPLSAPKLTDKERVERLLARFKKDLALDAPQESKAREILSRGRQIVNAILLRLDPEVQLARTNTRAELTKVLTPAQAVKYEEMVKRYRARKAAEEEAAKRR